MLASIASTIRERDDFAFRTKFSSQWTMQWHPRQHGLYSLGWVDVIWTSLCAFGACTFIMRACFIVYFLVQLTTCAFSLLFKVLHLLSVVFLASIFVGRNCAHIRCSSVGIGLKWCRNHFRVHITYDLQIFPAATTNLRSVSLEMKVLQLGSFFLAGSSACTALAFGHIAIFKLILRTPQQHGHPSVSEVTEADCFIISVGLYIDVDYKFSQN